LVALTWLGKQPSEAHEVAHNDGVRTNNHRSNLRWATAKENQADRIAHGTYVKGEKAYSAKLSDQQAAELVRLYQIGGARYVGATVTMQDLANQFDISVAQVSRIVNGKQRAGSAA